ncbi:MAG: glycosyltransferase family 2 protein [Culicoidibacterales bacterium]
MKKISLVIPMYNEEEVISLFFEAIEAVRGQLPQYQFECIIVNDGSKDQTLAILLAYQKRYNYLQVVTFSRNFGHEAAVAAGLNYATGDAIIVMDADLQDPPELIIELIAKWEEGYEVVNAKRQSRLDDSLMKRVTAAQFYKIINAMSGRVEIPINVGNYRLISRKVLVELQRLPEKNRGFRILVPELGYKSAEVGFVRPKRSAGKTHYNWLNMTQLAIDGITSASTIPLRFATNLGLLISGAAFIYLIIIIIQWFIQPTNPDGWSSLMVVVLFLGGIQLVFLGILGEYLARIFIEVKERPMYHVEQFYPAQGQIKAKPISDEVF